MSVGALLSRGRAEAEALMLDTCSITRGGTSEPVFDPATGLFTPPGGTVVYAGKCRVKAPQARTVRTAEAGERQIALIPGEVHIPVVSGGYRTDPATGLPFVPTDDDTVVITAVGRASDPSLLAVALTIEGPFIGSLTSSRRMSVQAVV